MTINDRFIINLKGKSYVTYEGLLDLAHKNNLKSINVDLIQIPSKDNDMTAICKATALSEKGSFTDFGDASPQSVNSQIVPHLIRMASTRAKARTLRDFTNVGMTAIEELDLTDPSPDFEAPHTMNELDDNNEEPPTPRQLETIKKLSQTSDTDVDYSALTKRTASTLISKMLDEKYNRH